MTSMTLSCQQLTFRYHSKSIDGINDVNLILHGPSTVALIGPSGSGKTTLLKLFAGVLTPQKGQVYWDQTVNTQQLALFSPDQHQQLGDQTSLNLLDFLTQHRESSLVEKARDLAHLLELTDYLDSPLRELSSGQQYRAALAQYFMTDQPILLLDEPFVFLDAQFRHFLAKQLFDYAKDQGQLLIWSSHHLEDVLSLANDILVLEDGSLIAHQSPQALFYQPLDFRAARFIYPSNLILARTKEGQLSIPGWEFDSEQRGSSAHLPANSRLLFHLRPHQWQLSAEHPTPSTDLAVRRVTLREVYFLGPLVRYHGIEGDWHWWVELATSPEYSIGQSYWLSFTPSTCWAIEQL